MYPFWGCREWIFYGGREWIFYGGGREWIIYIRSCVTFTLLDLQMGVVALLLATLASRANTRPVAVHRGSDREQIQRALNSDPLFWPFRFKTHVLILRPPFTFQRLCELVTSPRKNYAKCEKFLRAIEKNLMVVSPWTYSSR